MRRVRPSKFLLGSLSGAAVVFIVVGLMMAGIGRQPTAAAPAATPAGTAAAPCTTTNGAGQASPGTTGVSVKQPVSAADQQIMNTISDAEFAAAARTLGLSSANDLTAALTAGKSVAQLAAANHTTTDQVQSAMEAAGTAAVAGMLRQAQVTQQQADTLDQTVVVAIADKVTHVNLPTGATPAAAGQSARGSRAVSAKQPLSAAEQQQLDTVSNAEWAAAAQILGISVNDLTAALNAGTSVDQLATQHHTTTAQVRSAMVAAGQAAVASALRQGQLTQNQADTLDQTLVLGIADKVTHAVPAPGTSAATPAAAAAKQALAGDSQSAQAVTDAELGAVAQLFGLTPAQFKVQVGCGTLGSLPRAQHVSASQIRGAALAAAQAVLDGQVRSGALTQAQADSILQGLATPLAQKLALVALQPPAAPATPQP